MISAKLTGLPSRRWALVAVLVTCSVGPAAEAAGKSLASEICVPSRAGRIVDKQSLASALLARARFNAGAIPPSLQQLSVANANRKLVGDTSVCDNNPRCSGSDKESLFYYRGMIAGLVNGLDPDFKPTVQGIDPAAYMMGRNETNAIQCVGPADRSPRPDASSAASAPPSSSPPASGTATPPVAQAAVTPPPPFYTNFRIRGSASDLYIDRRDEAFKSTSQAVASLSTDGTAGKTTSTLLGVIGYRIPTNFFVSTSGERLDIIPYFSIDRVLTEVRSDKGGTASATEILSSGIMAAAKFSSPGPVTHYVNVTPAFVSNLRDDSSIAALNLQYVPVINTWVNAYIPIKLHDDQAPIASIRPILDGRIDAGWYTNRGDTAVRAGNRDFVRLGGQVGASLVSDDPNVPIELRSTYTGLYGARGGRNIGLFENTLNWSLNRDKNIALIVSYSNGNREDTGERQQQVLGGISVRY